MVQMVLADPKHRGAITRAVTAVATRGHIGEREAWRIWRQHGRPVLEGKPLTTTRRVPASRKQ
jgi:hypothetical protein